MKKKTKKEKLTDKEECMFLTAGAIVEKYYEGSIQPGQEYISRLNHEKELTKTTIACVKSFPLRHV